MSKTKFGPLLGPLGGGCSLLALSPKFQPHAGVIDDRIVIILHMGRTWGISLWGCTPCLGGQLGSMVVQIFRVLPWPSKSGMYLTKTILTFVILGWS